eukprot:CFRG6685T1
MACLKRKSADSSAATVMPSTYSYNVGNGSYQRSGLEYRTDVEVSDLLVRSYGCSPRSGFSTLTEGEYMRFNISSTPSPSSFNGYQSSTNEVSSYANSCGRRMGNKKPTRLAAHEEQNTAIENGDCLFALEL